MFTIHSIFHSAIPFHLLVQWLETPLCHYCEIVNLLLQISKGLEVAWRAGWGFNIFVRTNRFPVTPTYSHLCTVFSIVYTILNTLNIQLWGQNNLSYVYCHPFSWALELYWVVVWSFRRCFLSFVLKLISYFHSQKPAQSGLFVESLHQERTHPEWFSHSKCWKHLASRWN